MKKAEIPDVVWEHEKYLFENHKIFYPPVLKMFAQIKKAYTLETITRALENKDPESLVRVVTGILRGEPIPINADVDWAASNQIQKEETFKPPASVAENAKNALSIRAEKPPSQRGMTPVGLARARDLMNRKSLSLDTIKRMVSYFARHEVDKKGSTWNTKGKGWQAWNGWGGDEGRTWAEGILDRIEKETVRKSEVIDYEDTDEILIGLYEQAATEIGAAEQAALAMTTSFRLENPLVFKQIRTRAGDLITDVDSTTRRAVVEMVKQYTEGNYAAGANMATLAREIRSGIGMHPTHAKWWMNQRQRWISEGMTGRNLTVASEKYAKKLINYRSRMIARTEMAFAMERGRAESWLDAQNKKFLPPNQKKKWFALLDAKTSDICQALNDTEVALDENFITDDNRAVMGAPAHPFCRSVVILVRDYDWRKA